MGADQAGRSRVSVSTAMRARDVSPADDEAVERAELVAADRLARRAAGRPYVVAPPAGPSTRRSGGRASSGQSSSGGSAPPRS